MDPLTIGVLSASILVGLGAASLAGPQGLERLARPQAVRADPDAGDRGLPPASGRIEIADLRNASASSRRSPPVSISKEPRSPGTALSPQVRFHQRPGHPFRRASFFWAA